MSPATSHPATARKPSPMRVIRQWLFRERAVRGPAAIELDVVDHQIGREECALQTAAGEAHAIETTLTRARQLTSAALSDPITPGVIDDREADGIARELITGAVQAHAHTQTLEALT